MKIILPTLGYSVLHIETKSSLIKGQKDNFLKLEISDFKASAKLTSNGLEVQKGSEMNPKETPSLSGSYSNQRKTLIEKGIVVEKGKKLEFTEDFEFPSPSTAAAIILT